MNTLCANRGSKFILAQVGRKNLQLVVFYLARTAGAVLLLSVRWTSLLLETPGGADHIATSLRGLVDLVSCGDQWLPSHAGTQ